MTDFARQHYETIAKTIRLTRPRSIHALNGGSYLHGLDDAAAALAKVFEADNPNFARERWLNACGCYGGGGDEQASEA